MRKISTILFALCVTFGAAAQAAPYPQSSLVSSYRWYTSTFRSSGVGGDIWPSTTASNRQIYTAYGDAALGSCGSKRAYGTAYLTGSPSTNLRYLGCGPTNLNGGKIGGMLAVGNTLYASVNLQDREWPQNSFQIWWSTNGGISWSKSSSLRFTYTELSPRDFVNKGIGYANSWDHVFMFAQRGISDSDQDNLYMMRLPRSALTSTNAKSQIEYYAGGSVSSPTWSRSSSAARPIFTDSRSVQGPTANWDEGLQRYILAAGHGHAGQIGIFEGLHPWGPWRTIAYEERWLGNTGGEYLGISFPTIWQSNAGRNLWAIFSCYGCQSRYHDRFNIMQLKFFPQ